ELETDRCRRDHCGRSRAGGAAPQPEDAGGRSLVGRSDRSGCPLRSGL
ncbi:MAG: hypothetical protein AVDCRST_MAG75-719, partial [uncultured Propionibacteriaceae bacterium]